MAFFANINAQLALVRDLVEDLKHDLGSIPVNIT
jgi:hypothetical protein